MLITKCAERLNLFSELRYGLFIHYGLYSLLSRGEWAWNREEIPAAEYQTLADRFTAEKFDAEALCLLATAAQGCGNLLLNIGPRGDGSVPEESIRVLETVGAWLARCGGEAIYDTELFTFDLQQRGEHRSDWSLHGPFTVKENNLYWIIRRWPGGTLTFGGLQAKVRRVSLLGESGRPVTFRQEGARVTLTGLPVAPPDPLCPVLRVECDRPPELYQCGGLRIPSVPHPHYDPCPSDIKH